MANCVHCFQIRAQRRSWTPELSNRIQLLQQHVHNQVRPAAEESEVQVLQGLELKVVVCSSRGEARGLSQRDRRGKDRPVLPQATQWA